MPVTDASYPAFPTWKKVIGTSEKLSMRNSGGSVSPSVNTMKNVASLMMTSTRRKKQRPSLSLCGGKVMPLIALPLHLKRAPYSKSSPPLCYLM